jgi:DNA polymerase I-like protein with 3'-5' exonuclease and polymerase domains
MDFGKYNIIDTPEKLEQLDKFLFDGDIPKFDILSIDTETNGLAHYRDVIIGFSISTDENSGFYIPLLAWLPEENSIKLRTFDKIKINSYMDGELVDLWREKCHPENITQQTYEAPEIIKKYAKKWFTSGSQLILHNALFDATMIWANFGFDISEYIFCDTMLLHHVIDENSSHGLKEIAIQYSDKLGFNADAEADAERTELGASILKNGGTYNTRTKHIWRGDFEYLGKYAISDTFLTYKLFQYLMQLLDPKLYSWFFYEEVMPLCKEVLIPMKLKGVPIDVDYFKNLQTEIAKELDTIEDLFIEELNIRNLLEDFDLAKSFEEEVPKKSYIEKIIQLENLEYPTILQKGEQKQSLAKKALENAKIKNPHWLWDYLTGDDEIKYSEQKQQDILTDLYYKRTGRRHRFNIRSDEHLRWLFCTKLGHARNKLPQTESATPTNPIPSMKAEVLQDVFLKKYKWIDLILKYKKIYKLWSTYINGILEREYKGVLYPSFLQHGTTSGRFAARDPNLQNLPRAENVDICEKCESTKIKVNKVCSAIADVQCLQCGHIQKDVILSSIIKRGFIAPKGYRLINADFSALEAKIFSFMSGSPKLKKLWEKGEDLYSRVYIDVFKETQYSANPKDSNYLKTQNPKARNQIKPVVLGVTYGAKEGQVANIMNLLTKAKVLHNGKYIEMEVLDYAKGAKIIRDYLNAYPELRDYMMLRELEAINRGWVETIIGRRRNFKYAPYIDKLLKTSQFTMDDFLALNKKQLEKQFIDKDLTKAELYQFVEYFGIESWKVTKSEFTWYTVKNLLKHDLDNAKNFPIQGLAAHITNRAMIEIARLLKSKGINAYLTLQVHDEITGIVEENQATQAEDVWREGMENNIYSQKLDIKMEAKPIICDTLDKAK